MFIIKRNKENEGDREVKQIKRRENRKKIGQVESRFESGWVGLS